MTVHDLRTQVASTEPLAAEIAVQESVVRRRATGGLLRASLLHKPTAFDESPLQVSWSLEKEPDESCAEPELAGMTECAEASECKETPGQTKTDLGQLERLRRELERLERGGLREREALSTGLPSLDAALPERGVLPGSLVEFVARTPGAGVGWVALPLVREACRRRDGLVVLVDRFGIWYPPTLAAWGISLDRLLWVRPKDSGDECWAIDQALRCPGVAVVWSVLGKIEARWGRRFRVAAETGRTLGLIEGTAERFGAPPLADLCIHVQPQRSLAPSPQPRAEAMSSVKSGLMPRVNRQVVGQQQVGPTPGVQQRERGWQMTLEVLRGRGRAHGLKLKLEIDVVTGAIKEWNHARLSAETNTSPNHLPTASLCTQASSSPATETRDEGLRSNVLESNGLGSNGLGSNGLGSNGLGSNGLGSNGAGDRWLRENDPQESGATSTTVSRDLVARLAHPAPSRRTARA